MAIKSPKSETTRLTCHCGGYIFREETIVYTGPKVMGGPTPHRREVSCYCLGCGTMYKSTVIDERIKAMYG